LPKPAAIDPARKTGSPVSTPPDRSARPAPKPFGQPTGARSPSSMDDNDYIDADVIDEDIDEVEEDEKVPPPSFKSKPASGFPAINKRDSGEAKPPPKPLGKSPGSLFSRLNKDEDDEEDDKKDDDLKYVGFDDV
jgi:hypothetical protein